MKLIDKLLRLPLAPEVLTLLEKIDSIDSMYDTSYLTILKLLNEAKFGFYERRILQRSLNKISRRHAYSCAMHVVIKNELPEDPRYKRIERSEQAKQHRAYMAQQAQNLNPNGIANLTGLGQQGQVAHGLYSQTPYEIYNKQ